VSDELGFNEVEFFGQSFRMNPGEEYEWEMMEFASAAQGGADSDLLSGAATVHAFLRAVVHADDWARFREVAKKNKAQVKRDLMPVVVRAFTQTTERPTSRSSDSSGGPKSTKAKSAGDSSSKVIKRLEKRGRPDLALMVMEADEVRSARSA
jgi:hypothetical protein